VPCIVPTFSSNGINPKNQLRGSTQVDLYTSFSETETSNRACATCADGDFSASADLSSCTAWRTCVAGEYQKTASSASSNRTCEPCVDGKFSASAGRTCTTWKHSRDCRRLERHKRTTMDDYELFDTLKGMLGEEQGEKMLVNKAEALVDVTIEDTTAPVTDTAGNHADQIASSSS